jgi:serine phosphatase RsbU (regulator of sigma subunit)
LLQDTIRDRFVTAFIARLHLPTGMFLFASAGQRAYHVRTSGEIVHLDSSCRPLGLQDLGTPEVAQLQLQPEELVLVPSDGLFDAVNPDFAAFGRSRALDCICTHRHQPAGSNLDELYRKINAFANGARQIDDITTVLLKVEPNFKPDLLRPTSEPDVSKPKPASFSKQNCREPG